MWYLYIGYNGWLSLKKRGRWRSEISVPYLFNLHEIEQAGETYFHEWKKIKKITIKKKEITLPKN